ncbi:MAG TPA: hypothetical protein VFI47_22410 [Acidimicrobiales bacterium]|nr:hypothetical protein [Acidimicrobiales bacterium]
MTTTMIRAEIKPESVADVESAAAKMFAAIDEAQPAGVRYASCKLPDGVTFVILLDLENGPDNPLAALPEFREFQENLRGWIAGPPSADPLTVVGSYRLF